MKPSTLSRPTDAPHDCPRVMRSRYGSWTHCRCGWISDSCTTTAGASYAWAVHVLASKRREGNTP